MGQDFLQHVRVLRPIDEYTMHKVCAERWQDQTYILRNMMRNALSDLASDWNNIGNWAGVLCKMEDITQLQQVLIRVDCGRMILHEDMKHLWRALLDKIVPDNEGRALLQYLRSQVYPLMGGVGEVLFPWRLAYEEHRSIILRPSDKGIVSIIFLEAWERDTCAFGSLLDDIADDGHDAWDTPGDWDCLRDMLVNMVQLRDTIHVVCRVSVHKFVSPEELGGWQTTLTALTATAEYPDVLNDMLDILTSIYTCRRQESPVLLSNEADTSNSMLVMPHPIGQSRLDVFQQRRHQSLPPTWAL